jgi:tRNA(Ile)-lysidine synthase
MAERPEGPSGADAGQLRERVRSGGLLRGDRVPARPVLAMYSGGRDSTCLLDVAVALLGRESVSALHVNYGLRETADADERHCAELCERLGVELRVVRAGGRTDSEPGNLQAWARDLRYRHAREIAHERDWLIATGHTASDQLETILYRLAASPGRRALLGMPASDGRLIRPLLELWREETAAYCRARGLAWREDESNEDERFARTRVREGLVPALRAVHPAASENVLRTAALLREESELLEQLVQQELAGRASIAVARLRELPAALARMVVVRLAEDATGTYVPQAGDRVRELVELAGRSSIGRGGRVELHLGGQAAAVIERGQLRMVKLAPRDSG